jgi:hypothetical protein
VSNLAADFGLPCALAMATNKLAASPLRLI